MFTPLSGTRASDLQTESLPSAQEPFEEARKYLKEEESLVPLLDFIEPAIRQETVQCMERFHLGEAGAIVNIEVLNFTEADVEACSLDAEELRESAGRTIEVFIQVLVTTLMNDAEKQPKAQQPKLKKEALELERRAPRIKKILLEEYFPTGSNFVELRLNGQGRRALVSTGEDMRAVVLPCPVAVNNSRAQEHSYVLLQAMDCAQSFSLLELPDPKNSSEMTQEDLGRLILDLLGSTAAQEEDWVRAALRETVPCLSFRTLWESSSEPASFVEILENLTY
jgi:hypothetical protein